MKFRSILITGGFVAFSSIAAYAAMGKADIRGTAPDSVLSGQVEITETKKGLKIEAKIKNAPPGRHGFHIHEFGDCGDSGKAAGGHYNPKDVKHGFLPKDGLKEAHAGDLGNIEINDSGDGSLTVELPHLALAGEKFNVAGRAVVLHEKPDDFGQPTGNAGGRIGCGPIVLIKP